MAGDRRHFSKTICQHQLVISENKRRGEKKSYPILCPLCHLHQINQIKIKFMQLRIYFNVVCKLIRWFLTYTWIRWVIQRYFQRVVWRRRGQRIRRNFDILFCRMDTFLFLHVFRCGFAACWYSGTCCFLFIQASISACFFRSYNYSICFNNLFVFSPSFLLELKMFLSFLSPSHCIIITLYVFRSLLSLVYHAKISRSLWIIFFSGWDWRASYF